MKRKMTSRGFFGAKDLTDAVFRSSEQKGQWSSGLSRLSKTSCDTENAEDKVSEDKIASTETQESRLLWESILLGDY